MLAWSDPIGFIRGATPVVRRAWESLGIRTVGELLETPPRRYDDYSRIVNVSSARIGDVVTMRLTVVSAKAAATARRGLRMVTVKTKDATGFLTLNFLHQPWITNEMLPGRVIYCSGKIGFHRAYGKSLINPLWEPAEGETLAAGKVAPVYALSGSLTQKRYRQLIRFTLENVEWKTDPLDEKTLERFQLIAHREAIERIHEPKTFELMEEGRRRLAFDELLAFRLALTLSRLDAQTAGAPAIPFDEAFAKRFVAGLPYPMTADQKRSVWSCLQDMEKASPMRRLLEGDVGSGKTLVAAFIAAHVQRAGLSAVMLAPTDILARQHAQTLARIFGPHHVPLILFTRTERKWILGNEEQKLDTTEKTSQLIRQGNVVMVGTHALLQADRLPSDLALAIVDEQHRFGVEQREMLTQQARQDGRVPHFLSMTATPIPRSLALALFGDVDVSVLHEKPVGRKPIETIVCLHDAREQAYAAIRAAVARKEKAFVVCPLIDPSDALGVRSATDEWKRLQNGPLKGLRLGLLHGRMKPAEKEKTMESFVGDELDVLVATAVIEVGVDVPQATVIAIECAERFGLAQLHQLRGRVGRSTLASRCYLLTDNDGESLERLRIVARTQDGFALAEADLKRRGSGELIGTTQSGFNSFKFAQLTDTPLMSLAGQCAQEMLKADPTLSDHPTWKSRIESIRQTSHLE